MPSSLDAREDQGVFLLEKGDSGSGKTTAALSFPSIYMLDFDQKMPGIAKKHYPEKDIQYDVFSDIFQIEEKLSELKNFCPYETILADSFTALTNLVVSSVGTVKGEQVPDLLKRVTKSKTIEMMGIDYYSAEDRYCVHFIETLRALFARPGNPKNVIVTAHVLTVDSAPDLKTKIVTRTRSIVSKGKKVAAWLPTVFDDLYVFGWEKPDLGEIDQTPKRFCKTVSYDDDAAKCSLNLPETIYLNKRTLYEQIKEVL